MWRIVLLAGLLALNGCAWKAYNPKTHGRPVSDRPPGVAIHDPAVFTEFQKLCIARATGVFGLQLLDEEPTSSVFARADGAQSVFHFQEIYAGESQPDTVRLDALLALGPWEIPPVNLTTVEPRLRNEAQLKPLQAHKLVSQPIAGGRLGLVFAFEGPTSGRRFLLTQAMLKQAPISEPDLLAQAYRNLEVRLGPAAVARGSFDQDSPLLTLQGEQAAVRILSPALLSQLTTLAGGDVLVALPTRDSLLAVAQRSQAAATWLAQEATQRSQVPGGLTPLLFRLAQGSRQLQSLSP